MYDNSAHMRFDVRKLNCNQEAAQVGHLSTESMVKSRLNEDFTITTHIGYLGNSSIRPKHWGRDLDVLNYHTYDRLDLQPSNPHGLFLKWPERLPA